MRLTIRYPRMSSRSKRRFLNSEGAIHAGSPIVTTYLFVSFHGNVRARPFGRLRRVNRRDHERNDGRIDQRHAGGSDERQRDGEQFGANYCRYDCCGDERCGDECRYDSGDHGEQ